MREVSLPVKVDDKTLPEPTYEMKTYYMMYPHEIIAYLFNQGGLHIDPEEVRHFWRTSRQNKEPWALHSKASESHIPLGFYGDGATLIFKYGKHESVIGLFMSLPLWRPRSVRCSRFLLFVIEEASLWRHHTLNCILRKLVWSYNLLDSGIHPSMGMGGERLPTDMQKVAGQKICNSGAVFSCTEIRGDWSWIKKIFRCKASWQGRHTCHQCSAKSVGPYSERYYNFEGATWDVDPGENYTLRFADFLNNQLPSDGICYLVSFLKLFISLHPDS